MAASLRSFSVEGEEKILVLEKKKRREGGMIPGSQREVQGKTRHPPLLHPLPPLTARSVHLIAHSGSELITPPRVKGTGGFTPTHGE